MEPMITQLMNSEFPYGDPEFTELQKEADAIQKQLAPTLGPRENELVQQLADIPIRQFGPVSRDAFMEGFCAAYTLLKEIRFHQEGR